MMFGRDGHCSRYMYLPQGSPHSVHTGIIGIIGILLTEQSQCEHVPQAQSYTHTGDNGTQVY